MEDLRKPIGEAITLKNPPVTKVEIAPLCPMCSSYVGNDLKPDTTATAQRDGRLEHGIVGICENCGEAMFTPFAAIYDELRRLGVMK